MKILCVSDHIDPLVYSPAVKQRFSDVELVLGAGDLPMEYLGFIASSLNTPVGFVFGNHNLKELPTFEPRARPFPETNDPRNTFRNTFGATYLEDRVVRMNGLLVAGLGGSIRYNHGPHQFTEGQMRRRMLRLLPRLVWNRVVHGRYLDILVTHAAPLGIHDKPDPCHVGFRSLLWFMERFRPRYLIHGHIHLYDLNEKRRTRYHETEVVNVYDHFILDWEESRAVLRI